MKNKFTFVFSGILGVFCLASVRIGLAADLNCTQSPDCDSLGYTKDAADCDDGIAVKCPTDPNKVFCRVCAIGSILGNDQLCYEETLPSGVKPIGVVFDPKRHLAVALTDITSNGSPGSSKMSWGAGCSSDYYTDCMFNCEYNCTNLIYSSYNRKDCEIDGRVNTDTILEYSGSCEKVVAAKAVNAYEPSDCNKDFCKKTKWFLPSVLDLSLVYDNKIKVNDALSLLGSKGAVTLAEGYYWTSNRVTQWHVLVKDMDSGRHSNAGIAVTEYVRPVVKY